MITKPNRPGGSSEGNKTAGKSSSGETNLSALEKQGRGTVLPLPQYEYEDVKSALLREMQQRGGSVEESNAAYLGFDGTTGSGAIAFKGTITYLGITLGAMVAGLWLVVGNGHPVKESYIPMLMLGGASGAIVYLSAGQGKKRLR